MGARPPVALFGLASFILLFQSLHHLEHVAQVAQVHLLTQPVPHARGLLGAHLDLEWVHLAYNWALEGLLLALLGLVLRRWVRVGPALIAVVLLQGYHAFEHGLKMYQYLFVEWYRFGFHAPPGLLPRLLDAPGFLVHFWLNMAVWTLIVVVWWSLRPGPLRLALPRLVVEPALWRGAAAALLLALLAVPATRAALTVHVPAEAASLQAAVDAAWPGSTVVLAPGIYEPVRIGKPLTVRAAIPGTAIVRGPEDQPLVHVRRTHDVTIHGLRLEGGRVGVLVQESQLVHLSDNRIRDSWWAGIRLSAASAEIVGNEVQGTRSPYGMGIELANTHSRPPSRIAYNRVASVSQSGIDLHNAEAEIVGNVVTGSGLRGIAITEMSRATVRDNRLTDNADAGIHVIDMSHARLSGNVVSGVRPGPYGWAHGIRVEYHAEAVLGENEVAGAGLVQLSGGTVRHP